MWLNPCICLDLTVKYIKILKSPLGPQATGLTIPLSSKVDYLLSVYYVLNTFKLSWLYIRSKVIKAFMKEMTL